MSSFAINHPFATQGRHDDRSEILPLELQFNNATGQQGDATSGVGCQEIDPTCSAYDPCDALVQSIGSPPRLLRIANGSQGLTQPLSPNAPDAPLPVTYQCYDQVKFQVSRAQNMGASSCGRFSWYVTSNLSCVMGPTQESGRSGKFHTGYDGMRRTFGIKEFRLAAKAGVDHSGYLKTAPTHWTNILDEAFMTLTLRGQIEAATKHLDEPTAEYSWAKFRLKTANYQLFDLAQSYKSQKAYLVGTRYLGSLANLHSYLAPSLDGTLALSAAVQIFTEIGALHATTTYAHLDIKPENIFYDHRGSLYVMDFGLAQRLAADVAQIYGRYGSLAAPEMITNESLTAHVDTFATGLMIFGLAGRAYYKDTNPFYLPHAHHSGAPAYCHQYLQYTFDRLWAWKKIHQNAEGLVQARSILDYAKAHEARSCTDPIEAFFLPLTRAYPELSELLLNDVLVQKPSDRLDAAQVAHRVLSLPCARIADSRQQQLRRVMAGSDPLKARPALRMGLESTLSLSPILPTCELGSPPPVPTLPLVGSSDCAQGVLRTSTPMGLSLAYIL